MRAVLVVDVNEQTMGTYTYTSNTRIGIDYMPDTECKIGSYL